MLPSGFISPTYNLNDFNSTLTLAQTDARYLQLGGGTLSGNLTSPSLTTGYLLSNRTTNGQTINSTNGTSSCVLYHFTNGDAYFGTTTANNLVFQTGNTGRLTIGSTGAISGISSLNATTLITSELDFNSSSNKTVLRTSTISGSSGIEVYDTQFSTPTNQPLIDFQTGNNSDPIWLQLGAYQMTGGVNALPYQIRYISGLAVNSGLNITCSNTSQATNNNYNVVLSARNGTIPHLVVNDQKNQLHLFPQNLGEINTTFTQNVIVGSGILVRQTLAIGDSPYNASGTAITALDSTMAAAAKRYITLGQTATANNQAELSFYYSGSGSTSNAMCFGLYGGEYMRLTAQGRLGIGTTSPICPLQVAASNSYTQSNIAINSYQNNISTNTWTNLGGGPTTYTLSAAFSSSILVGASVYATSDRRLKTDIVDLDVSYDHYNQLQPKMYRYKNETNTRMGFIAQEMNQVFGNLIMVSENDNLKKETDDDPEDGTQLSVDYQQMTSINCVLIKKLIAQITDLTAKVATLETKSSQQG